MQTARWRTLATRMSTTVSQEQRFVVGDWITGSWSVQFRLQDAGHWHGRQICHLETLSGSDVMEETARGMDLLCKVVMQRRYTSTNYRGVRNGRMGRMGMD